MNPNTNIVAAAAASSTTAIVSPAPRSGWRSAIARLLLGLGLAVPASLHAAPAVAATTTEAPVAASADVVPEAPPASEADMGYAKALSRAFQTVAARVEPSVVHITQLRRQEGLTTDPWGNMRRIRGGLQPSGLGSGFFVSREGHILTNNHVVGNASELRVKLNDGTEIPAKIVGRDGTTDLAVLKIDPAMVPGGVVPVEFGPSSEELEVGEWVIAIGSPLGFSRTVTAGIVSAKGRSLSGEASGKFEDFIQTDAAINPGNSGGPLLNLDGKLVGINTAIASRTGGSEGLGFAIPSEIARFVFESISVNGVAGRGAIGVNFGGPRGVGGQAGVEITRVLPGGPADRAGIKAGDVVVKYDGRAVDQRRVRNLIGFTRPGTRVLVDVLRDGASRQIPVTIGDSASVIGIVQIPELGIEVQNIESDNGRPAPAGVFVRFADQSGRAGELEPNDIIVGVQRPSDRRPREIRNAEALRTELSAADLSEGIRIFINNGRRRGYIDIEPE